MIRGMVTRFKARILVRIVRDRDRLVTVEAAVDTGFNGMLTLPTEIITSLGLPWESESRGILADGRISYFDLYSATIVWHANVPRGTMTKN